VIYPPELLDKLQGEPSGPFDALVYRHMFGDNSPFLVNTRGARWNPPEVGAIYTSLQRDGALAEADYRISLEPFRPKSRRTLHEIAVELAKTLDLSDGTLLAALGIDQDELSSTDLSRCQEIGGATAYLGYDGLLVPSARHGSTNLVIFPAIQDPDLRFEVTATEEIGS
jgi:RES domain-containing protein